jgi:crotonobetainyl-CoA:carnitine CoA-transferase CaiB-like acyl-CoA transferase
MDAQGLIWAPVATLPDVIDDPQAREMGWFATVDSPALGRFETLDTPFKLYGADVGVRGPAPAAGEHTFEVLTQLGLGDDELARLAEDGVIG